MDSGMIPAAMQRLKMSVSLNVSGVQVARCRQQHFIDLFTAKAAKLHRFFGNDGTDGAMPEGQTT